jgi:Arc/MetJ-type ribon-helix-helix transcriptional regulator
MVMPSKVQIPGELDSKIEEVTGPAGYQSKSELVRDAVRRRVEELQADKMNESSDSRTERAGENLKHIALDRGRGRKERRQAVHRLGGLGEVAIESLSEVAREAKDSRSHIYQKEASGADIRRRARDQIKSITDQ